MCAVHMKYFVHHFYLYRNFIYLFRLYICLRCGEFYCICGDWLKIVYDLEQGSCIAIGCFIIRGWCGMVPHCSVLGRPFQICLWYLSIDGPIGGECKTNGLYRSEFLVHTHRPALPRSQHSPICRPTKISFINNKWVHWQKNDDELKREWGNRGTNGVFVFVCVCVCVSINATIYAGSHLPGKHRHTRTH